MTTVQRLATPLVTTKAFCEVHSCIWHALGKGAGRKAREHTKATGHTTYAYCAKTVYYETEGSTDG